jgi:hypothetical protein
MTTSEFSLNDIMIAIADDPTRVIQADSNGKLELWKLLEASDRQRFVLTKTDSRFWTISSVTGGVRVATKGEAGPLVLSASSTSETEWFLEFVGELAYGIPVRFKSRTPDNHYMTVHGNADGSGEIRATPPSNYGQLWTLVQPKTRY